MPEVGIDMAGSGWENPEGFKPTPRPNVPAPPPPDVCEAKGPHGWVCDLPPGHQPADRHRADDGSPEGFTWSSLPPKWTQDKAETVTWGDTVQVRDKDAFRRQVQIMAESALESERPGVWSGTLMRIVELCQETGEV